MEKPLGTGKYSNDYPTINRKTITCTLEYISEIQEMWSEMPTKDEYTNSIKAAKDFLKNETQGNFEFR